MVGLRKWSAILFFVCLFLINSLIFGCAGSSLLGRLFSSCGGQGLLSSCGAQASRFNGFSCCRAQALDSWASVAVAHRHKSVEAIVVMHGLRLPVACGIFTD